MNCSKVFRFIGVYGLALAGLTISLFSQNTVGLLSMKPDRISPGYNLIFPYNQSVVYLLDNCGEIVHSWPDEDTTRRPGAAVYLMENGNLLKCSRLLDFNSDPIWAGGGGGIVEIRSWDNELLHSFELNNTQYRLHHDVEFLPDGHILMIAWEKITEEETKEAGRDVNELSQHQLWPDKILEWDPELDSIVWEWRMWDHIIQDRSPLNPNFGVISEHPERIDVNYDTQAGHPDWMHTNSIDYNPVLDQIMLCSPHFDEIWVIDHSTTKDEARTSQGGRSGKGGDILYRWGNPAVYQQNDEALHLMHYQHDAQWVNPEAAEGSPDFCKVSFYNNRVGPALSTANEITLPYDVSTGQYTLSDENKYGPKNFDRTVIHPKDDIRSYSNALSSAQVLPNGNMLILSARWGYAYEIAPDGDLVWEYLLPIKGGSRVSQGTELTIVDNITFRMDRYAPDYPAFAGKDLTPEGYLELNPDENFCSSQTSSIAAQPSYLKVKVWPNPSFGYLHLDLENNVPRNAAIFNLQGKEIKRWTQPGNELPIHDLLNGVYFLRIDDQPLIKIVVMQP